MPFSQACLYSDMAIIGSKEFSAEKLDLEMLLAVSCGCSAVCSYRHMNHFEEGRDFVNFVLY